MKRSRFLIVIIIILVIVGGCGFFHYRKKAEQMSEVCTRYNLTKEDYKKTLAIRKSYQEYKNYTRSEQFLCFDDDVMVAYLSKDRYENGKSERILWDSNENYHTYLTAGKIIPVYELIETPWLDDLKSINLKSDVLSMVRAGVYEKGSYNINEDFYFDEDGNVTKVTYYLEWQSGHLKEQYDITYEEFS